MSGSVVAQRARLTLPSMGLLCSRPGVGVQDTPPILNFVSRGVRFLQQDGIWVVDSGGLGMRKEGN